MSICRALIRNTSNAPTLRMSGEQIRLQVPPRLFGVNSWVVQMIVKRKSWVNMLGTLATECTCILCLRRWAEQATQGWENNRHPVAFEMGHYWWPWVISSDPFHAGDPAKHWPMTQYHAWPVTQANIRNIKQQCLFNMQTQKRQSVGNS